MMSATDERYYFVCRLCALKCGQLTADDNPHSSGVPIFSDEGQQRQVPKKILDCLQFVVHDGDKFPRTVCRDCLGKLDDSHEFLIKCLESQQFLADLATHEVFDTIYEQKHIDATTSLHHHHHHQSTVTTNGGGFHQLTGGVDDGANDGGLLPDTSTIAADLEQLVDEAHMHATDITQMIRYHDGHMHDDVVGIHDMEQLAVDLGDALPAVGGRPCGGGVDDDVGDDDSLPDIQLYSFEGIQVTDSVKGADSFDLDEAARSFQTENVAVDYADRVVDDGGLYTPSVHNDEPTIEPMLVTTCVEPSDELNPRTADAMTTIIPQDDPQQQQTQAPSMPRSKICTVCAKTCATNYKLTVHMRTHSHERPFHCTRPECGKTFRSNAGLLQHEAQHTGAHQFTCSVCGKGFQVRSYLTSHMKCHSDTRPYECSECGERFRAKQTCVDHEARHLGVKAFQCGTGCKLSFISKALCVRHEKLVHGGGNDGRGSVAVAEATAKQRFGCALCVKQFTRKSYLKTHMLSHTGERPFACDLCDRRMSTANDLKLHRRTHTGEAAYVCETCGKSFKRRDTLVIHRRSHTGDKPYECTDCGQRFTQVTALKLHQRLHSGDRPYACPVCPRWFVSGSILTSHLKKHSNRTMEEEDEEDVDADCEELVATGGIS